MQEDDGCDVLKHLLTKEGVNESERVKLENNSRDCDKNVELFLYLAREKKFFPHDLNANIHPRSNEFLAIVDSLANLWYPFIIGQFNNITKA